MTKVPERSADWRRYARNLLIAATVTAAYVLTLAGISNAITRVSATGTSVEAAWTALNATTLGAAIVALRMTVSEEIARRREGADSILKRVSLREIRLECQRCLRLTANTAIGVAFLATPAVDVSTPISIAGVVAAIGMTFKAMMDMVGIVMDYVDRSYIKREARARLARKPVKHIRRIERG